MALTLAPTVELILIGAMLDKILPVEAIEPKTLSHTGQKIYKAAQSLGDFDKKGALIAAVEVFGLDKARLHEYMVSVEKVQTKDSAKIYELLKQRASLIQVSNEVQRQLGNGELDVSKVQSLVSFATGERPGLASVSDDLADGEPTPPEGPPLKTLPKISSAVNGVHGLWVIAGTTGIGKSTLARQIVVDASREVPGIIYSFEDTRREILYQLCANMGLEVARKIGRRLYIRDSLRTLHNDLARIPPPATILVDSIQRVPVKSDDYLQGLNNWINRFEEIKQRGYSVVLCSEVNRAAYTGDPRLDAFKESGRIEYASTFAVILQEADGGLIKVNVVKNRSYPTRGMVTMIERSKQAPFWFKEVELNMGLDT